MNLIQVLLFLLFRFWKIFTHLCYVFFTYPAIKQIIVSIPLAYSLTPFLFITFSTLNSFNSFFVILSRKMFQQFLYLYVTNNICPRPIWNITFCKNVFVFWYFNNMTNFKFRILIINFVITVNLCASFYINRFHFNYATVFIIIFTSTTVWRDLFNFFCW